MTTRAAVLAYIREHVEAHGYAPTLAEIAAAVGLAGKSGAAYHVNRLVEQGAIEHAYKRPRGIRVLRIL